MNLIPIEANHPQLALYGTMRARIHTPNRSFIADSPKVVNMLLEKPIQIHSILATQAYYDAHQALIGAQNIPHLYVAPKAVLETIVGHKLHHNVMMHGTIPLGVAIDALDDAVLMVDMLGSEENIGSLTRSAAALGITSMVLPQKGPQPYGRRALRVSMGHASFLNYHYYDDLLSTIHALKAQGYTVFAAEVGAHAQKLSSVTPPKKWVLLMGNEDQGLSPEIQRVCDATVQIEMIEGIRSFNVAIAASIMIYRFLHP